ncbi:MAG: hypothetical protein IPI43_34360 [Sandaracinaceae bacterium]|jgi:hypothetical protein|nr:hypothetical protein [Sandaracinaceae bacterium]MBK7779148.1 hypothetical protein [Sandaracinaceae bacterium]
MTTLTRLALLFVFVAGCDAQGACTHSYGTPNVTFECRGGTFEVTCVGTDPARSAAPPYECTCRAPDGATTTFAAASELWTYNASTDFSAGYAAVNAGCHWELSH